MIRRLRKWWLCRKHGICPIHFTLMNAGGGYEPRWWCDECQRENGVKHEDNLRRKLAERLAAAKEIASIDRRMGVRP